MNIISCYTLVLVISDALQLFEVFDFSKSQSYQCVHMEKNHKDK